MSISPTNRSSGVYSTPAAVRVDVAAEPNGADMPVSMPAEPEQAARDIANVGVEGRPADARSGPGLLRLEMLAMLAALVLVAAGVGMWLGWGVGLTMLGVGALALIFNPVLGATAMRTADRKQAADMEREGSGSLGGIPQGRARPR